MAVGLNAKIPHAAPEAAPAAAGDKGGDGEGFAQMLTGIVSGPKAAPASVPVAAGKSAEGDATAQILDIASPAAPVAEPTATAPAQAIVATALQVAAAPQGLEAKVADRPPPAPTDPQLGYCMVDLGDLTAKLLHLQRALGLPDKDGKASDDADGDSDADGQDSSTEDQVTPTALAGAVQPPAPAIGEPAIAKALPSPAPPTAAAGAPKEEAAKVAVQLGAAIPAPLVAQAAAQPEAAKVAIQSVAAKDKSAKVQDLLKSLEPVKPFELPQQLRSLMQTGVAVGGGKDSPADAAQAALAALNRSSDSTADAPLAPLAPAVSPMFGASVQALVQPQLAADTLAATDAPAADGPSMPDTAQLGIDRQLDIARDNQWLDRLARDISRSAGQEGTLKFKLNPETLGTLHVEVAQSHSGTSVRLTTDTEAARSIIADAQPRLIAEARAQGVRIAEAHVGLNSNGQHADQRRQDDARQEAFVRTARPAEADAEQPQQSSTAAAERFA